MSSSRQKAQVTPRPRKVHLQAKSLGMETGTARRRSLRLIAAALRARKSSRRFAPFTSEELKNIIDLCLPSEESGPCESTAENSKSAIDSDNTDVSSSHDSYSPSQHLSDNAVNHSSKADDFDTLIDSIDDYLFQPLSDSSVLPPVPHQSVTPTRQEMFEARKKLPLLLATDNPAMLSSNKLSEILHLTSILKTDSHLSADQLNLLKLIEEIPLAIKEFQENEKTSEEADNFFDEIETNIAWATTLQNEYNESKEYECLLRTELSSNALKIKSIDEEITALQSRRAELSSVTEMKKKEVEKLIHQQEMEAEFLPKVVNEIELAKKQKPEWEVKKKISEEQKYKILSKFAILKGFSL